MAFVNKAELAFSLGVAQPTLTRWLMRWGDAFPVIKRGSIAGAYMFDVVAVSDFLRARREEDAANAAARDQKLAHFQLPSDVRSDPPMRSKVKEELDAWRLRRLLREDAERAGRLIPAGPVLEALTAALARLSRDSHALLRQVGREQGWSQSFSRAVEVRYADCQRAMVRDLDREFSDPAPSFTTETMHAVSLVEGGATNAQ